MTLDVGTIVSTFVAAVASGIAAGVIRALIVQANHTQELHQIRQDVTDMKAMIGNGKPGVLVRRDAFDLYVSTHVQQHGQLDSRIANLGDRIAALGRE